MAQGYFERDDDARGKKTYRLRWLPEPVLSEHQKNYARFVRYLITAGRMSETTDKAIPTGPSA